MNAAMLTSTQAAAIAMALVSMLFAWGHVLAAAMPSAALYAGMICGELVTLADVIPSCIRPGDSPDVTVLAAAFVVLCAAKWAWWPAAALIGRLRAGRDPS